MLGAAGGPEQQADQVEHSEHRVSGQQFGGEVFVVHLKQVGPDQQSIEGGEMRRDFYDSGKS